MSFLSRYFGCRVWSPDGNTLASGGDNNIIGVWDPTNGDCFCMLAGHLGMQRALEFSSDSKLLASASVDQTVRIWDIEKYQCRFVLAGHTGKVRRLSWSRDDTKLASGSSDRTIRIWCASTGSCLQILSNPLNREIDFISWSRSERIVGGTDGRSTFVWNATNANMEHSLGLDLHRDAITRSLTCSHDGDRIAAGSLIAHVIRIWSIPESSCERVLATRDEEAREMDRWADFEDGSSEDRNTKMEAARNKRVRGLLWSSDDSLLLSMCQEFIAIWDVRSGVCTQTLSSSGGIPPAFSPYEASFLIRDLSEMADPVGIACKDVLVFGDKACALIGYSNTIKFFQLVRRHDGSGRS
eukprot:Sro77_g042170.1 Autophagy-related protein 16 (354) ;mRNA; r:85160-86221